MTPPLSESPATGSLHYHFSEEDLREFSWQLDDHHHHGTATVSTTDPRLTAVGVTRAANDNCTTDSCTIPTTTKSDGVVDVPKNPESTGTCSESEKAQARSERKRSREKQRRSDVNRQFADLTKLLRRIEQEDETTSTSTAAVPTNNRVDLIARTIAVLEKMHDGNKKRKFEIINLSKELEDVKKEAQETAAKLKEATLCQTGGPNNKVMMMVPMMVSTSSDGTATAAAAAAAPAFPMAHGFMPPYMGMPQMAGMQQMAPMPMMQHMPPAAAGMNVVPNLATTPTATAPATAAAAPAISAMSSVAGSPASTAAAPAQAVAPPQQQGSPLSGPQDTVWKGVANVNGGGNLAHCA